MSGVPRISRAADSLAQIGRATNAHFRGSPAGFPESWRGHWQRIATLQWLGGSGWVIQARIPMPRFAPFESRQRGFDGMCARRSERAKAAREGLFVQLVMLAQLGGDRVGHDLAPVNLGRLAPIDRGVAIPSRDWHELSP